MMDIKKLMVGLQCMLRTAFVTENISYTFSKCRKLFLPNLIKK